MNVRRATIADSPTMRMLYSEFFAERPPPPYLGEILERELAEVDAIVADEFAFLAEVEGTPVGFVLGRRKLGALAFLSDLYVRPKARRTGVAGALVREFAAALRQHGFTHVTLEVDVANDAARAAYERWGFREAWLGLVAELEPLEELA